MTRRVTVVGAGILGLSAAVRLAEDGLVVDVLTRSLPVETTSAVAGGLWLPAAVDDGDALRRAGTTLAEFRRLADDEETTGVRLLPGTLMHRRRTALPGWATVIDEVRLTELDAPARGFPQGHRATLPLVHMPRYLQYLTTRLRTAGGTITRHPLAALPSRGLVVNCTGVAARQLVPDPDVRPVRSQVVLLTDPGLTQWWCARDGGRPLYVLPRGRDVVVGGTHDDGDWNPDPDPQTGEELLERARALVPELAGATVLGHRVGVRPAGRGLRIASEELPTEDDPDHVRVHCYGASGSGLTQSWGCAGEVLDLVRAVAGSAVGG